MKKKKFIKCIFTLFFTILTTLIFISSSSFGASTSSTTKYLSLYSSVGKSSLNGRPTGFYTTGQNGGSGVIPIIKIIEVYGNGNNTQKSDTKDEIIYCLNNGVGFGQGDGESQAKNGLAYTNSYNMRNPSAIESAFGKSFKSNNEYNQLMWLLDNICKPEDASSVNNLFNAAKLGENKASLENELAKICGASKKEAVFKDIIECIQQAAIWNITGAKKPATNININVANDNGSSTSTSIVSKYYARDFADNPLTGLYSYLISSPKNHSNYDYTKVGATFTFNKSSAKVSYSGSNAKIGPYQIIASNYTNFTAKVTNGTNEIAGVKIVDSNGAEFTGSTVKDKIETSIKQNKQFYIQLSARNSN